MQQREDARPVVVVREHQQFHRVGVQEVAGNHFVQFDEARIAALRRVQHRRHQVGHREIHHRRQAGGVAIAVLYALLPIRHHVRVVVHFFADDVQQREFVQHRAAPLAHERRIRIRIRVLADARQVGVFDPPQRVLDQVARQQGVALVQVRHPGVEPAVEKALTSSGATWISCTVECWLLVGTKAAGWFSQSRGGQVLHPPVAAADVVEDDVVDHAHAARVGGGDVAPEVVVAAEARIDLVEIGERVTVVRIG